MEMTCHPRERLANSPVDFCSEQPAAAGSEAGGGHRNQLPVYFIMSIISCEIASMDLSSVMTMAAAHRS
jgi:hypothetical protein